MQEYIYTSDAFPVVGLLTPADFVSIPYTPALLLPVVLDASITSDPDYGIVCQDGFDAYFAFMYILTPDKRMVFVNRFYTQADVQKELYTWVIGDVLCGRTLFSSTVAFSLGWLSALALTDRALADYGVQLLLALMAQVQGQIVC